MDSKISELPVSSTLLGADILPVVSAGATKSITAGVFSLNLPNLGNKGITKNVVTTISSDPFPVTGTLVVLQENILSYSIPAGTPGQEITIVSSSVNSIDINTGTIINLIQDSVITLLYIGTKWIVKNSNLV